MMKRFGMYDNDFNNLFECYTKVTGVINEAPIRQLPSETRDTNTSSKGDSFPGLKQIKVFVQKPGRGADLMNMISVSSVDSDDRDGGAVISGNEHDRNFHVSTTKKSAQIKTIDRMGNVENDFVTNIEPRFDPNTGELTIIHVEEL